MAKLKANVKLFGKVRSAETVFFLLSLPFVIASYYCDSQYHIYHWLGVHPHSDQANPLITDMMVWKYAARRIAAAAVLLTVWAEIVHFRRGTEDRSFVFILLGAFQIVILWIPLVAVT